MWTPVLVCEIFCTLVPLVVFPQDPQEADKMRDNQPPRGTEGTGPGAMEQHQVVVSGVQHVLHVCFLFASRGRGAV